ncbi:MAG: hypothetical protein KBT58_10675 [Bizionia sp.]|nr:hypothetical protein [Bizionia sp.]
MAPVKTVANVIGIEFFLSAGVIYLGNAIAKSAAPAIAIKNASRSFRKCPKVHQLQVFLKQ